MKDKLKFIVIENDAILQKTLIKYIEKIFNDIPIHKAKDGAKAYEIIEKYGEYSIIISEPSLPEKSGLELLNDVKNGFEIKNAMFFIIVFPNDKETKVSALKAGVDGYIFKPFALEEFIPLLRNAVNSLKEKLSNEIINDKYKQLKEDFDKEIAKVKVIIDMFIQKRIPDLYKVTEDMIKAATYIAKNNMHLDFDKQVTVTNAIKLFYSGRLFLEDKLVSMPIMEDGRVRSPDMKSIVNDASTICGMIKGYENVAKMITLTYENLDGTGFPKGLKMGEIPKESRLLRVILDYYELLSKNGKQEEIIDKMVLEANRLYDMIYVAYLDQYLALNESAADKDEKTVKVKLLRTELVLSRNIFLTNSLVLLSKSTVLTEEHILKIREVAKTDEIIGEIYVYDLDVPNKKKENKTVDKSKKDKK